MGLSFPFRLSHSYNESVIMTLNRQRFSARWPLSTSNVYNSTYLPTYLLVERGTKIRKLICDGCSKNTFNRPTLPLFVYFRSLRKNCWLQQHLNAYHWSRRWECWPLDHHFDGQSSKFVYPKWINSTIDSIKTTGWNQRRQAASLTSLRNNLTGDLFLI